MNDIAIHSEDISKRYRIGIKEQMHETLSGTLSSWLKSPVSNFKNLRKLSRFGENEDEKDIIWALKHITFQVRRGEVVGIIGKNGAGKSTLLKILSRIVEPTSGKATVHGNISSLLEVGTGFHPDLTGRENVYLNGSILGMTKKAIDRRFNEIVDFSGVSRFIDTPIKRYSSGMKVRLAFAVAAHIETEILLIDEVLAVGDMMFQKKCLGKMEEITHQGRTVLFVSHNLQAVKALCPRSILLNDGKIIVDDGTPEVVKKYFDIMRNSTFNEKTHVENYQNRRGSGSVRFFSIQLQDTFGNQAGEFVSGGTVQFALSYKVLEDVDCLYASVLIRSGKSKETITILRHMVYDSKLKMNDEGEILIEVPKINLHPGVYPLYFWLGDGSNKPFDVVDDLTIPLQISDDSYGDEAGFDVSKEDGFFDMESRLLFKKKNPH